MDANELVAALYWVVMMLMKCFMSVVQAVQDKGKRPGPDHPLEIREKNIKINRVLKRPRISFPFRNVVCGTRRRKKLRISSNDVFGKVVNNPESRAGRNYSEHKMPTESSLQSVVEMIEHPEVAVRQSPPRSPVQELADAKATQGVYVNLLPTKECVDISPGHKGSKKSSPAEKASSAMTCLDEEKLQRTDSKTPCVHGGNRHKLQFVTVKPTTPTSEGETENKDESKEKATTTGAWLDGILPEASHTDEITSDVINRSSAQTARSKTDQIEAAEGIKRPEEGRTIPDEIDQKNVADEGLPQDDPQEPNNDETTEIVLSRKTFNTHHAVDNGLAVMIKMLKGDDVYIGIENVMNKKGCLASAWWDDSSLDFTPEIYEAYENIMQRCRETPVTPLNVNRNVWAVGFNPERVNCEVCYDQPFEDVCANCGLRICRRPKCGRHGCRNEFQKAFVD